MTAKPTRRPVSAETRKQMALLRSIGYGLSNRPGERGYMATLKTFTPTANSLGGRLREALQLPSQSARKTRVYFVRSGQTLKVGCTGANNVLERVRSVSGYGRIEVELLGHIDGGYPSEKACHLVLSEHRIRGEWFHYTDEVAEAVMFVLGKST